MKQFISEHWIAIIMTYILVFFISLLLLHKAGKRLGFPDYDQPKSYTNYDDWDSNAQAYAFFALAWPIVMTLHLILGFISGIVRLSRSIQKSQE